MPREPRTAAQLAEEQDGPPTPPWEPAQSAPRGDWERWAKNLVGKDQPPEDDPITPPWDRSPALSPRDERMGSEKAALAGVDERLRARLGAAADNANDAAPDVPATAGAASGGADPEAWAKWQADSDARGGPDDRMRSRLGKLKSASAGDWASRELAKVPEPSGLSQTMAGPATAEPASAPNKSVIDPALADFLSKQTARKAELAEAQGRADEARRWATMSNGFAKARDLILGRNFDQEGMKAKLADADRPVTNLLQQNELERQGVKDFGAQLDVNKNLTDQRTTAAMLDPTSDISKRAQLLAIAQGLIKPADAAGYTASMHADMLRGATIQEAMAHHAATEKQAAAQLGEQNRQHQEREAARKDDRDLNYAKLNEAARQHDLQYDAKKGKEKEIPPRQLERLSAIKDSLASLDELENLLTAAPTGPLWGRMRSSPWQGPEATRADALSKIMLESLPRAFKNGVPSVQDMKNATAYVPTRSDTDDQIKAKIQISRQKVKHELELLKQTYGEGGLNTSRLTTGDAPGAAEPARAAPAAEMVKMLNPKGEPVLVAAARVKAALAAGGSLAP
jgi:hypothetical protein